MKVLLLADILNLGKIGEVVAVSDGFARNFLIPKGKACAYNEIAKKSFEASQEILRTKNQELLDKASSVKVSLSDKIVSLLVSASDDGRLYGSVSSSSVVKKINELLGAEDFVSKSDVSLKKPVKEVGIHVAVVALHPDVSFDINVFVARSEFEISSLVSSLKKAD